MKSQLIVMLTWNDVTVPNALDLFEESKDLPVKFWGFKDVGLETSAMKRLIARMKAAGKTTFLEVVRYKESECLEAARLALECGVDYLTGTLFYDSVLELIKNKPIKYFPFFGNIHGHPVVLDGPIPEIVRQGKELEKKGVDGLDLVGYRYQPIERVDELLHQCAKELKIPLILAGSIASREQIDQVAHHGIWAFTIGGAFFEQKFDPSTDFRQQIMIAYNHSLI